MVDILSTAIMGYLVLVIIKYILIFAMLPTAVTIAGEKYGTQKNYWATMMKAIIRLIVFIPFSIPFALKREKLNFFRLQTEEEIRATIRYY